MARGGRQGLPQPASSAPQQSRSAELREPSKLDVHRVGDGPGLAGQDEARLTILGFEDVVRCHVDLTGDDGAHARSAATFAARVGHVDTCSEHHVNKRGLPRPIDATPLSVEFHFSGGGF
jgi:hypothetical protein